MGNTIKYYPLTHPQKGIWYTEKIYPNTSIGNIAATLRLKGEIDYTILEKAINIFIQKNDGMRLRVTEIEGVPQQYVAEYNPKEFDFFDFCNLTTEELYKWDEEQSKIPFHIIDNDLFYFALVKINENDGGFFVKTHHLISDAWTMSLMGNQVVEAYTALKNGENVSNEKNPSYLDYIISEEEYKKAERFNKDKEYWDSKFEYIHEVTSIKTRTKNNIKSKSKRKTMLLPKKLEIKLRKYCEETKTSLYALLLAALSMYINRVTGKEDVILGTTTLNRMNVKEKDTVGVFINAVPLRIDITDNLEFKNFAQLISKETIATLRHQKYPYDLLVKQIREKHKISDGLFDIVLNYQNSKFNKGEHLDEYSTRWHFNGHQIESLIININDREGEGALIIDYDYLTDLFHVTEIEFIHQHIINLLWHAMDSPSKRISKLHMLSEKEYHKILYEFNNTKANYPKDKLIHQIFEEQAQRTPDNIAVVFENTSLTYRELNEKTNALARTLRKKGVQPDSIVGIMTYRSLEMVIGIMGILKAGGAYLPIDPDYPNDRIDYMLEDSGTKLLLTQRKLKEKLKFNGQIVDLEDNKNYSSKKSNLEKINNPTDLAYIIYTSGSTGKPKGVMIEHHSVINRINWMQKRYPLNEKSVILQKTPYTFDVSVWELFWWSFVGAKVCMLVPGGEKEPQKIIDTIAKNEVTTMHFVPSMLNLFLQYLEEDGDFKKLSTLRQVFASGEALNLQQVTNFNKLLNETNKTELYNLYGPTEATVDVSYYDCSTGQTPNVIPIGKPIDNISLYILDKNGNLQPIGIPGELCIGGVGVGRGYINKPELTNEKFVSNPFIPGEKMYRTGDLARWFSQGDIEYLGRLDFQVKIRGNRVELGEIENRLLQHENIKEAIVIAREDKGNSKYLCAYIVCNKEVSTLDLKAHLLKELPDYMVPSYFIKLKEIPLSSNGKVNRKALPEPYVKEGNITQYIEPRDETEKILARIWADVLKLDRVGIDDNIFDLGGDSLTIIEILTKIYKYKFNLETNDFYKYPTIRGLVAKIKGATKEDCEINKIEIATIDAKEEVMQITEIDKFNSVLLTGATGFLGAHILSELLENSDANIYCLVRGENKKSAEDRLKKTLQFYFEDKYEKLINKRILVLTGDVTIKNLGLSEQEYNELGKKIDAIIHTAASVKYFGDYREIEKVNVYGTKRVVDFALRYGMKLNYISTVSVTGNNLVDNSKIGKVTFTENDFYIGQNYIDNVYVRSKFEAENLVHHAIKQGLNATIFRMGNLTGRYSDGQFQPNISENAFYNSIKSIIKIGAVSEGILEEEIEITPVDCASRAIVKILKTKESSNRMFHILNPNESKLNNIVQMLKQIGIDVIILDNESLKKHIADKLQKQSSPNILLGLSVYLNETGNLVYDTLVNIDSSISQNYLGKLEIKWPELDKKYFKKLIDYMKVTRFL